MSRLTAAELEAVRPVLEHLAERVEAENAPFQTELPNGPGRRSRAGSIAEPEARSNHRAVHS
jgi:hypothetical protein